MWFESHTPLLNLTPELAKCVRVETHGRRDFLELLEEDIDDSVYSFLHLVSNSLMSPRTLNVSISSKAKNVVKYSFGKHAIVYKGSPDMEQILEDEINERAKRSDQYSRSLVFVTSSGVESLPVSQYLVLMASEVS